VECGCIQTHEYIQAVVGTISHSYTAELLEGFRRHLDLDRDKGKVGRGKVDNQQEQEVVVWVVAAEAVVAMGDTRRECIFPLLAS
jgi:hypothetical protein